ncbi:Aste57867_16635 [Aphanomyces stellatus]|uniref:Aste57867_16635 protein n=1 Tax=Aphanomyces stellatus TaxID=120398 RepID=A0A485L7T8_9STRA|nr:hypothetical protein As57867_016578 [Aphanomyces stellatus]VFT93406.1 Aste57867_16635 [Aphanomyces stellatus]
MDAEVARLKAESAAKDETLNQLKVKAKAFAEALTNEKRSLEAQLTQSKNELNELKVKAKAFADNVKAQILVEKERVQVLEKQLQVKDGVNGATAHDPAALQDATQRLAQLTQQQSADQARFNQASVTWQAEKAALEHQLAQVNQDAKAQIAALQHAVESAAAQGQQSQGQTVAALQALTHSNALDVVQLVTEAQQLVQTNVMRVADLERLVASLQDEKAQVRTSSTSMTDQLRSQVGELEAQLQRQAADAQARLSSVEFECTNLRAQLTQADDAHRARIGALEAESLQARGQANDAQQAKVMSLEFECTNLRAQVNQAEAARQSLEFECANLKSQVASSDNARQSMDADCASVRAQLADAVSQVRELEMALQQAQSSHKSQTSGVEEKAAMALAQAHHEWSTKEAQWAADKNELVQKIDKLMQNEQSKQQETMAMLQGFQADKQKADDAANVMANQVQELQMELAHAKSTHQSQTSDAALALDQAKQEWAAKEAQWVHDKDEWTHKVEKLVQEDAEKHQANLAFIHTLQAEKQRAEDAVDAQAKQVAELQMELAQATSNHKSQSSDAALALDQVKLDAAAKEAQWVQEKHALTLKYENLAKDEDEKKQKIKAFVQALQAEKQKADEVVEATSKQVQELKMELEQATSNHKSQSSDAALALEHAKLEWAAKEAQWASEKDALTQRYEKLVKDEDEKKQKVKAYVQNLQAEKQKASDAADAHAKQAVELKMELEHAKSNHQSQSAMALQQAQQEWTAKEAQWATEKAELSQKHDKYVKDEEEKKQKVKAYVQALTADKQKAVDDADKQIKERDALNEKRLAEIKAKTMTKFAEHEAVIKKGTEDLEALRQQMTTMQQKYEMEIKGLQSKKKEAEDETMDVLKKKRLAAKAETQKLANDLEGIQKRAAMLVDVTGNKCSHQSKQLEVLQERVMEAIHVVSHHKKCDLSNLTELAQIVTSPRMSTANLPGPVMGLNKIDDDVSHVFDQMAALTNVTERLVDLTLEEDDLSLKEIVLERVKKQFSACFVHPHYAKADEAGLLHQRMSSNMPESPS